VGHGEHTIRTYMWARDGDAWNVREVRHEEDDVVRRDEEDGVRDRMSQKWVRLHGQDVRWCEAPRVGVMLKDGWMRERRSLDGTGSLSH
jgi:hypothetical protein